jgi:hypothetical protein
MRDEEEIHNQRLKDKQTSIHHPVSEIVFVPPPDVDWEEWI